MADTDIQDQTLPLSQPATETRTPTAPEARTNPDLPRMPEGPSLASQIMTSFAQNFAPVLDPNRQRGEFVAANIARQTELRRRNLAAQQTQSLTQFLAAALTSGDPQHLASAIQALSKVKNLQPEAAQALQKLQIELGTHVGQQQQEERLGQALMGPGVEPEIRNAVQSLLRASPGLKPMAAMDLIKSGILGERSKLMHDPNVGIVKIPGTGIFGKPGEQPQVLFPSQKQQPTHDIIPPEKQLELSRAGINLAGRVSIGQLTPDEVTKYDRWVRGNKAQDKRDAMDIAIMQARAIRAGNAAPPGTYLDRQGNVAHPATVEDAKGVIRLDTAQEKKWEGLSNLNIHNDLMLQYVDQLAQSGIRPGAALKQKLSVLNNNPGAVALFKQLGAMTPLAMGGALVAGTGGRAGPALAKMLADATITEGDTLGVALEKAKNISRLNIQQAKMNGLPTKIFQDQLSRIEQIGKESAQPKGKGSVTVGGRQIVIPEGVK